MVPVMVHPEAGRYCHCELLDIYISKLPSRIKEMNIFYARPLNQRQDDESAPWFAPVPVGRNIISKVVSHMCHEAQIDSHKTNPSLKATGATQLYNAGVPEKTIQQRTGHRSLDSLRVYKHTSVQQHRAVMNILFPTTRPEVLDSVLGSGYFRMSLRLEDTVGIDLVLTCVFKESVSDVLRRRMNTSVTEHVTGYITQQ